MWMISMRLRSRFGDLPISMGTYAYTGGYALLEAGVIYAWTESD